VVPAISNEQNNAFTFHGQAGTKFFQLSRTTCLTTQHHIPENLNPQQQRYKNLKSHAATDAT